MNLISKNLKFVRRDVTGKYVTRNSLSYILFEAQLAMQRPYSELNRYAAIKILGQEKLGQMTV